MDRDIKHLICMIRDYLDTIERHIEEKDKEYKLQIQELETKLIKQEEKYDTLKTS